jgi:hypothetical protein
MFECNKCRIFYKTDKSLLKHQEKIGTNCHKYRDIIFVCRICNFNTQGVKNITNHLTTCTGVIQTNPLSEITIAKQLVEDQKKLLIIKIDQLELKFKSQEATILSDRVKSKSIEMQIINLQLCLQFEQMKNKIYSGIIQDQTNINLDNIIKESTDKIHVYNFTNGNIPISVHDFVEEKKIEQTYILKPPRKKKKKKKSIKYTDDNQFVVEDDDQDLSESDTKQVDVVDVVDVVETKKNYRTVKKHIEISNKELDNKLKIDTEKAEKEVKKIIYNNFDVSYKENTESIEKLFKSIENNRAYSASLLAIKQIRRKLLGKLNLHEYTQLLKDHVEKLTIIFKNKTYSGKKISQIIKKCLTPLDMRLITYKDYINTNIEIDDVNKFGLALDILVKHPKQFVPYDKQFFYTNIKNYGVALFEIEDCVKRFIINRYNYNNVVYVPKKNSIRNDPYSFYTLETIKHKRFWKMECRLEDFTQDFIDNIRPYCITLFRNIYRDIFHDNSYRSDYLSQAQIAEYDCEQLLLNIICLSKPIEMCKILQDIVKTNCILKSTELDKFNLYADDKLQQKRFSSANDSDKDICDIIKTIFDNISDDDATEVLNAR